METEGLFIHYLTMLVDIDSVQMNGGKVFGGDVLILFVYITICHSNECPEQRPL